MRWENRATFELWRSIVHGIGVHDALEDVIREWREKGKHFLPAFAEKLEADFGGWQGWDPTDVDSRFSAMAVHTFVGRVDWLQVSQRLVAHAESGPWPQHSFSGLECWCRQPVRCWKPAEATPPQVASASETEGREAIPRLSQGAVISRMDADTLFSVARSLDCAVRQLAPDQRERILEAGLLRRAREMYRLAKRNSDPNEPLELRTVWRTGYEPRVVHWCLGGTAEAGQHMAFEDLEWAACGAEVAGIYVGDDTKYGWGLMEEQPITCRKCLELFQAASA